MVELLVPAASSPQRTETRCDGTALSAEATERTPGARKTVIYRHVPATTCRVDVA